MKAKIAILGAGPAGIGLAFALEQRGIRDYMILESAPSIGGLSREVSFNGCLFDLGGHSFTTSHPEVRDLVFNVVEMFEQQRDARCYFRNQMIPYPFQQFFHLLKEKEIVEECARGLAASSTEGASSTFEEYLVAKLGAGIAHHFGIPYNRKLWVRDLSMVAPDWAPARVAPALGDRKEPQAGRRPLSSDARIAYPAKGAFSEIFHAMRRALTGPILFDFKAAFVDLSARKIITHDSRELHFELLVNTAPLTDFLKIVAHAESRDLQSLAGELEALPLMLGLLTLNRALTTRIQRIYCSESQIPFHKIVFNSNSSPFLRQQSTHGIMVEASLGGKKAITTKSLLDSAVELLNDLGIASPDEIEASTTIELRYGYPVQTKRKQQILPEIRRALTNHGVRLCGRFAEWDYINADEVLHRALELAREIV